MFQMIGCSYLLIILIPTVTDRLIVIDRDRLITSSNLALAIFVTSHKVPSEKLFLQVVNAKIHRRVQF